MDEAHLILSQLAGGLSDGPASLSGWLPEFCHRNVLYRTRRSGGYSLVDV